MCNEEKRKLFESVQKYARDEGKIKAIIHEQMIIKVIDEHTKLGDKKRDGSLIKRALAEERKNQLDMQAKIVKQQRMQEERERDEQR